MKKIYFIFATALSISLSLPALAQGTTWTLVKKNAGPASWDCPQHVQTVVAAHSFNLYGEGKVAGIQMDLTRLNDGVFCHRHQNGTIFGTLRCSSQIAQYDKVNSVYKIADCSSDLPLVTSCTPEYDEPSKTATISTNGTLIFNEIINWGDDHSFECQYKAD